MFRNFKFIFPLLCLLLASQLSAQKDTVISSLLGVIYLDSVVVKASKSELDVRDFIELCIYDTTFYKAFANMKNISHEAEHELQFFTKRGKVKAALEATTRQRYSRGSREMDFISENTSGKYKKKDGSFRLFTARMYEHLFFVRKREYGHFEEKIIINNKAKGLSKYSQELKKLVFIPGSRADVPFINDEMEIFSTRMHQYYNYSLTSDIYNGVECYIFKVDIKPQHAHLLNSVIVRKMHTYFEKGSLQILGRDMHLKCDATIYSFDVKAIARLQKIDERYFPEFLEYDGRWDIPLHKPEIGKIKMTVTKIIN